MKPADTIIALTLKRSMHFLAIAALGCMAAVISSCSSEPLSPGVEYMPDMYRSPAIEPYTDNAEFGYADSMSARLPAPGTIPRGYMPYPYPNTLDGYERAGAELKNPIPLTDETLAESKSLYSKYCLHCHGETGQGDGLVVVNAGFAVPPSFTEGRSSRGGTMNELSAGKIYHTIMYGLNMMGPHASQLSVDERWKIVYYVQELQHPGGNKPGAGNAEVPANQGEVNTE